MHWGTMFSVVAVVSLCQESPYPPPPLHSKRPCIVSGGGGAREASFSILQAKDLECTAKSLDDWRKIRPQPGM